MGRWARWTKKMDERLSREYPALGAKACAKLMGLTVGQVEARARRLGVRYYSRGRNWTPREDEALRIYYPVEGLEGCLERLAGRGRNAIEYRVHRLGLGRRNYVGGGGSPRPIYDHRALAQALGMPATPPDPGAVLERHYMSS